MMKLQWLFVSLIVMSSLTPTNLFAQDGHGHDKPVAVVSDPTLHQFNITSRGVTLGMSNLGGGYPNYLDLGNGVNLIAAAYGRGWQAAFRDQLHSGLYNPTQAGSNDAAGTPATLTLGRSTNGPGGRVEIHPFPMALWVMRRTPFVLVPWQTSPPGTLGTDGLNETGITLQQKLRSEFDFSGFVQDASGLTSSAIPIFQFDFSVKYARDPGPPEWHAGQPFSAIYQFGPKARMADGEPVLDEAARRYIGGVNFPKRLATDTDISNGALDVGFRIVYSAGYHTAMWLNDQGDWEHMSLDKQTERDVPIYVRAGNKTFSSFAVLANGDDPKTSQAIGLYVPQSSSINRQQIVGTDITTGKQVYTEDRRISWVMKSHRWGPVDPENKNIQVYKISGVPIENHMTVLHPWLQFTGLLAPSHALPNVVESLRCEEFVLIGTPDQIRIAVQQIRERLISNTGSRKGANK